MAESAGRLVDTLDLCGLAGPSWGAWRTIAKCLDGEGASLTPDERRAFEALTGRTRPPREKPAELFVIAGRRSGKSRFAGACGVRAASRQYPLAPGETAVVGMAAADRDQARVVLQYATAPFREEPALRPLVRPRSGWQALRDLVAREHRWGVDLVTGVSIEVRTSHFGKIRGRTFALAVADEAAFWAAEDGSNPASEVLGAIRPGLVTLGGQLVVISTPWAKSGPLYDAYAKYFGQDDERVLVVKAPSRALNPLIPEAVVREALDRDETAARSEWGGEFRSDLESFISQEAIRRVVVPGRTELAPRLGEEGDYIGFLDAADGAGQDSFTAAVCHLEREEDEHGVAGRTLVVLDAVQEIRPSFNPTPAAATIAAFLKSYGLTAVWGDRWARSWVAEAFARHGLALWPCPQTKSELEEAEARLAECQQVHDVAGTQWSTLVRAAYRARALTGMRAQLTAARALAEALDADRADRDALATALGLAAGSGPHPHYAAAELVRVLDQALRELDPPPPVPAPPPRAGYRRVQAKQRFMDLTGGWHFSDYCGQALGPEDLPAKDAEVALREGWVVEVDA